MLKAQYLVARLVAWKATRWAGSMVAHLVGHWAECLALRRVDNLVDSTVEKKDE